MKILAIIGLLIGLAVLALNTLFVIPFAFSEKGGSIFGIVWVVICLVALMIYLKNR